MAYKISPLQEQEPDFETMLDDINIGDNRCQRQKRISNRQANGHEKSSIEPHNPDKNNRSSKSLHQLNGETISRNIPNTTTKITRSLLQEVEEKMNKEVIERKQDNESDIKKESRKLKDLSFRSGNSNSQGPLEHSKLPKPKWSGKNIKTRTPTYSRSPPISDGSNNTRYHNPDRVPYIEQDVMCRSQESRYMMPSSSTCCPLLPISNENKKLRCPSAKSYTEHDGIFRRQESWQQRESLDQWDNSISQDNSKMHKNPTNHESSGYRRNNMFPRPFTCLPPNKNGNNNIQRIIPEKEEIEICLINQNTPLLIIHKDLGMERAEKRVLKTLGDELSTVSFYKDLEQLDKEQSFSSQLSNFPVRLNVVLSANTRTPASRYVSKGEDCFGIAGDDELLVLMPCGHVVGPESLLLYCMCEIKKGKSQIVCPFEHDTDRPVYWSFADIQHRACLSPTERDFLEIWLSKNWIRNSATVFTCPKCKNTIDDENNRRRSYYICKKCNNTKYCRQCFSVLNTPLNLCFTCEAGKESMELILQNCERISIVDIPNCPSVRSCPDCHLLIEYAGNACKHMSCKNCGCIFCFLCLRTQPKSRSRWNCGSSFRACPVAPVQKLS